MGSSAALVTAGRSLRTSTPLSRLLLRLSTWWAVPMRWPHDTDENVPSTSTGENSHDLDASRPLATVVNVLYGLVGPADTVATLLYRWT